MACAKGGQFEGVGISGRGEDEGDVGRARHCEEERWASGAEKGARWRGGCRGRHCEADASPRGQTILDLVVVFGSRAQHPSRKDLFFLSCSVVLVHKIGSADPIFCKTKTCLFREKDS